MSADRVTDPSDLDRGWFLDARLSAAERRMQVPVDPAQVRAAESAAGRAAARAALVGLAARGAVPLEAAMRPIGRGRRGEPLFPVGVVGSIAHGGGVAAAVCGTSAEGVLAVGTDVHPARPVPAGVAELVATPVELADAPVDADLAAAVVFSAKESVFKAWNPLTGRWLEFADVRIRLAADGTFRVRTYAVPGAWSGRWSVAGGLVRTAAWVAAAD